MTGSGYIIVYKDKRERRWAVYPLLLKTQAEAIRVIDEKKLPVHDIHKVLYVNLPDDM